MMVQAGEWLEFGQKFHGHKCPAMPVGLRVDAAAMNAPDDKLLTVPKVFDYELKEGPHSFDGFVCKECGEMTVMQYGRIEGGKTVCIDGAAK
jgi:formylmethanofuran dehydrogenase subunit E